MGRVRTKRYEAGGISRERYLELLWLSRQYDTMRRNRPGDPLSWRAKVIESAAQTAAGDLWPYVLQNVTHGTPHWQLDAPCCKNTFFAMRKQYFFELDRLLAECKKT